MTDAAPTPITGAARGADPAGYRARWPGALLAAAGCASIALAAAWSEPPTFTATVAFALQESPAGVDARDLQTWLVGLDERSLGRRVVERLDLQRAWALAPGWQADARLARRVRVLEEPGEASFRVEVRDRDAALAAAVADACVDELRLALAAASRPGLVEPVRAAQVPKLADRRHDGWWAMAGAVLGLIAHALARGPARRRGNLR